MPNFDSRKVALTAMCAALYAAGIYLLLIPTPWGVGQLRIAVVIPAFFAFLGGPWVAAIGAAIGTFIGDVIALTPAGLSNPLLSLVAGVPANFFGFLVFGYLIKRFNNWKDFTWINLVSLTIGNAIAGFSVAAFLGIIFGPSLPSIESRIYLGLGLTIFWVVTMLPFNLTLVPLMVKYLAPLTKQEIVMKGEAYPIFNLATVLGVLLLLIGFVLEFPLRGYTYFLINLVSKGLSVEFITASILIAGIASMIIGSLGRFRKENEKV